MTERESAQEANPMRFKLEGTVRELHLKDELQFDYGGSHSITVILRPPTDEEQKAGHHKENAMSIAVGSLDPSSAILDVFLSLSRREVPKGYDIPERERTRYLDEDGKLRPNWILPMEFLPGPFRDFSHQLYAELWDHTRRTAKVLRWRLRQEGPHNPFSLREFYWSLDGVVWMNMPHELRAWASVTEIRKTPSEEERKDVLSAVGSGVDEPLGHELYREAWEQRRSNPRSALVVGIAALEVGFKNLVSYLVPETRWLLENLPAPPLHRLLAEYLPQISTKNKIDGKVLPPPPELIAIIRNGLTKRNVVAHVGASTITHEELEELLFAIRDVLWLLDYYSGLSWALANIRPAILEKLRAAKS